MATASLLAALVLAALSATAALDGPRQTVSSGCQASCGGVDIPYPFGIGIGVGCFRLGFEIACVVSNGSAGRPTPVLAATSPAIQVLDLSVMPRPEARVMLPVAYQCYNNSGNVTSTFNGTVNLNPAGVYRISDTENELFVLGCDTLAYIMSWSLGKDDYQYYAGCVASCEDAASARDGACAGVGCCHVDIPPGLTDNAMYLTNDEDWSHDNQPYSPCDYAFVVEKGNYTFRAADLRNMPVGRTMPLRLDWAIRGSSKHNSMDCVQAKEEPGYACLSNHSQCVSSTNGPGYVCNCTRGYEGNPYVVDGCGNIDECKLPLIYPCYGKCQDTEGSYDCRCYPGYESVGDAKDHACNPKFSFAAKLALGIALGVFFLVVSLLLAFIMLQKRKLDALFKKNGGTILQNVKGLTIYTKDELKKITDNNSEFLGNGAFGQVYKGTLPDKTIVAVKSSIRVNKETVDEFTREVEIQTQMIYKNILRLHGCCLEVDVPMLVYEFAANGSLQHILHVDKSKALPLDLRLNIAIGSAEGLRYMHSYANQTIRHGDIKPDNILLDDKLTPKISDFGLSKLLKEEYFAKKVVGCMGYMDPVFMKTGLLTQKSDVYSFGAVLLELITRKKIIYDENCSLVIDFRKFYEKEKTGRSFFDKEISCEEDIFILEEIGKLARECLKEDLEERPDMTEVAERLVMLRRDRKLGRAHKTAPCHFANVNTDDSPHNFDIKAMPRVQISGIYSLSPRVKPEVEEELRKREMGSLHVIRSTKLGVTKEN